VKKLAVLLTLAGLARPVLGQVPVMLPEFQVNTSSSGASSFDGIATGKDGRFVVTWTEGLSNPDVLARNFDAQGTPLDDPFAVNAITTGNQGYSSVARDASGRLIVVWYDNGSISGRRFRADGTPLGRSFRISTSSVSSAPRVASDLSGNFVAAWNSNGQLVARRFDSNDVALGDPFPVGSSPLTHPGLAMSTAGFVVAWTDETRFANYARRFDPAGNPMTDAIPVAAFAPFSGLITGSTDVAMGEDGAFVVVWGDCIGDPCFPIGTTDVAMGAAGAKGRRYFSDGTARGDSFLIQPGAMDPLVASDSVNNFLVTWASGSFVGARYYDIFGQAVSPGFQVNQTAGYRAPRPALADDGSFVVAWTGGSYGVTDVKGRKSAIRAASAIDLDSLSGFGFQPSAAAGNGVFEPGETVVLETAWVNDSAGDVVVSGVAPLLDGPFGPTYTINDNTASYGAIAAGQSATCVGGADCYSVTVSAPAVRPVQHWDAHLQETLSIGVAKSWKLHIGESFPDVPTGNMFYASIETLFHNGVTGGCFGGGYCPSSPVTRAQMAVFLLKSRFGAAHIPPPCTGAVFSDVDCGSPYDPWIEELAALGVTGGCGGDLYCPGNSVTREQMAVFLLKTRFGSAYTPPACTQQFDDVPCGGEFAPFINDLYARGITGGCSSTPALYCPGSASNRGQMAVFLTKTFGLVLYGG
jgi:hypothetical protein